MDDLNYLSRREQEELARAHSATSAEARGAHEVLAGFYGQRIRKLSAAGVDASTALKLFR